MPSYKIYCVNYTATVRGSAYFQVPEGEDPAQHSENQTPIEWDLTELDNVVEWDTRFVYEFSNNMGGEPSLDFINEKLIEAAELDREENS